MAREFIVVRIGTARIAGRLATVSTTRVSTATAIETDPMRISTLERFSPHRAGGLLFRAGKIYICAANWSPALGFIADWIPLGEISNLAALAARRCAGISTT